MVFDKTAAKNEDQTFFDKLGGIEGLTKVVTAVFKAIEGDLELKKFYQGKDIEVVIKKYTYYIASQIGHKNTWLGKDVGELHAKFNQK